MMTDDERGDSTRASQFSPLSGRRLLIQLKAAARVTSTTVVMPPLERCGYSVKRCSDPIYRFNARITTPAPTMAMPIHSRMDGRSARNR